VERAQRGDRAAFAELYDAYADALYAGVLLPRTGSPSAAEDALAETFRTALETIAEFAPGEASIWFWLARIAANKANDVHRRAAREGRFLIGFENLVRAFAEGRGPEREAQRNEARARARELVPPVLARLNERYRRAIELRFLQERDRESCAVLMDVQVRTFDVVLLRALRAFRREWDAVVGAPPEVNG